MSKTTNKFSPEVRERAVRMVLDNPDQQGFVAQRPVRDSSRESSVVAGLHEQTHPAELQDQELAGLQ